MLINLIALAAMAGVAYMGLVHGVYRSVQVLVACILAGAIAFGLLGPAAAMLPGDNPRSIWYFAADPFCLWALFCVTFLTLRTLGEKLLKNEPEFNPVFNRAGGAAAGVLTGYLAAGVCLLLVQMLPTSPDFLGYEAFRYRRSDDGQSETLEPGRTLWLKWDRGALEFFGYLSSEALGAKDAGLLARWGDVYPPPEKRAEEYQAVLDADDFLYYYWYRRYEFILWQTGAAVGPVPAPARGAVEGPGLVLGIGQTGTFSDISLRMVRYDRLPAIDTFPQVRPAAGEEFMVMTVRFRPTGRLPRTVDSSQFFLLGTHGERFRNPLVYGRAKPGEPENQIVPEYAIPPALAVRGARFNLPPGKPEGNFLASGALFTFTQSDQFEVRTFVFSVPKPAQLPDEFLRLNLMPAPPTEPAPTRLPAPPSPVAPAAPAGAKPPSPPAAKPVN